MARRKKGQPITGWLILDKPVDLGSTEAVNQVRRLFDARKAGHGGTLDPFATGLLPIALGEATKTVSYVMDGQKSYRFTIRFGVETDTLDTEGVVVSEKPGRPNAAAIKAALPQFIGTIQQVPPVYSAIKVDGKRAYDLARDGQDVTLKARPVVVDRLELIACPSEDEAVLEMQCGKGTYVRALARDLAYALGTCAHVTALRRVAVAGFTENQAISLDALASIGHKPAELGARLLPIEAALDGIPAIALSEDETRRIRNGQCVSLLRKIDLDRIAGLDQGAEVLALYQGKAVALAVFGKGQIKPVRGLNTDA